MLCLGPSFERGDKLAEHTELTEIHSEAGAVLLAPTKSTPPITNKHTWEDTQ